ncbi:prepilin-type N-terminal cleavage/methylation domain-containing protein [Thiohalobacter sp. IOR34]|uniref:PulJ/GspJ family protein n=1 Tax=Thiohalobacter sp. IOR34 TaxID=3057176 RepID=UPI0025B033DC|nr:prepilin-type N-terminal cleavage/methylation domain-containing protein [Thiohalobacter sp. IOR34]WJW75529.1 prepilin-type N-terminal cleavage/methylation domain-containing protein [Thiohalobacter sp. IOR34]
MPHPARHCTGFTLIELVVTLMVVALLAAGAAFGVSQAVRAYLAQQEVIATLSELRLAGERLARELRSIRRDPAAPGSYDILVRTASRIDFRRTEADGTTVTQVSLNAAAPLLSIAYDSPAGSYTLSNRLSSLAFSYLQDDGSTASSDNSDIAFIEYELVLSDSQGNSYPQRGRVQLRNRL